MSLIAVDGELPDASFSRYLTMSQTHRSAPAQPQSASISTPLPPAPGGGRRGSLLEPRCFLRPPPASRPRACPRYPPFSPTLPSGAIRLVGRWIKLFLSGQGSGFRVQGGV